MTKKAFDVCGIGNAIVDILTEVPDTVLEQVGIPRGSMRLFDSVEQKKILAAVEPYRPAMCSGGSVANSVFMLAQLGAKTALLCSTADDRYGLHYQSECQVLGVTLPLAPRVGRENGTSVIMVTPDAERSMCTSLGVSAELRAADLPEEIIADSAWLFVEGYLFANPEYGQTSVARAVDLAKKHGTKVAVTFSEAWVVESFRSALDACVEKADLVFANHTEATAYTGEQSPERAFEKLLGKVGSAVVTVGPEGAFIALDGARAHVPAVACTPVDLTGAGDAYAAGILYGIVKGARPESAGRGAAALATRVITQIGARLKEGVPATWKNAAA